MQDQDETPGPDQNQAGDIIKPNSNNIGSEPPRPDPSFMPYEEKSDGGDGSALVTHQFSDDTDEAAGEPGLPSNDFGTMSATPAPMSTPAPEPFASPAPSSFDIVPPTPQPPMPGQNSESPPPTPLAPYPSSGLAEPMSPTKSPAPMADVTPNDQFSAQPQPMPPQPMPAPEPMSFQPVVTSPDPSTFFNGSVPPGANPMAASTPPKKSKKRLLIPIIVIAVLLLAGGGYVFGIYLPNTPSGVYASSVRNTGLAFDRLVAYTKNQEKTNYKSLSFNGSAKYSGSGGSMDFSLSGAQNSNANLTVQAKADIMGENLTANLRSIKASGNDAPDIYLQVSGVKSLLDSVGMGSLDSLDGQWVVVDHTIVNTLENNLRQNSASNSPAITPMTDAQLNDMLDKVQAVNKQYLFTTNSSTAVLANEKYLGKVNLGGRSSYHYKVGYNKAHLEAYVSALQKALDSSGVNTWFKKTDGGKNLSSILDLGAVESGVKSASPSYMFDLWTDINTKLIRQITFTDPSDSSSKFTISQNYTGGAQFPFLITISDKDDSGHPESGSVGVTLNTQTNKVGVTGSFTDQNPSAPAVSFSSGISFTPSDKLVTITAPSGAQSIDNLINELAPEASSLDSSIAGMTNTTPQAGSTSSTSSDSPLLFND